MNKKLLTSVVASGLILCGISGKAEAAERSNPPATTTTTKIFIGRPQAPQQNAPVTRQRIVMKSASRTIVVNTQSITPVTIVKERPQKGRTIIKKEPNKITIIEQNVRAD